LKGSPWLTDRTGLPSLEWAPQIVVHGAPMRNIPPCAACHGAIGYKVGTEWLKGESPMYLRAQLARRITPAAIARAAAYYMRANPRDHTAGSASVSD
jgi:hypothetical protein